jgi:ATP-dependent Clp protease protease subunit
MCDVDEEVEEVESRHIHLFSGVEDETIAEVVEAIHSLTHADREEPIHLHLFTSGGDMDSGMALVDIMQARYTAPVHTYAWGDVCSAGAFILAAGWQRAIGRHAHVMLHPMGGGSRAPSSRAVAAGAKAFEDFETAAWSWLDGATSQEPGYWWGRSESEGEVWLNASQALALGLVDKVVLPAVGA